MYQKCKKHRFYKADGCPICKQIAELTKKPVAEKALTDALYYFSKNESQIAVNLFAAESIIASVWDLGLKIKADQRQKLCLPLINKALEIADQLNIINSALASAMSKKMGAKEYSELIVDTVKVLDIVSGKMKKCETCITALDRKKVIRAELEKEVRKN